MMLSVLPDHTWFQNTVFRSKILEVVVLESKKVYTGRRKKQIKDKFKPNGEEVVVPERGKVLTGRRNELLKGGFKEN